MHCGGQLFGRQTVVHLAQMDAHYADAVRSLPFVKAVDVLSGDDGSGKLVIGLQDPAGQNPEIVRVLAERGARIQFVNELRHSARIGVSEPVGERCQRRGARQMRHIRTIILKEWEDALHNKMVFYVIVLVPLLMVILPIALLYLMGHLPISERDMEELGRALNNPMFQGMAPAEAMQSVMTSNMLVLFLIMPVMVPVTIASYSIVGEKVQRSLEPLLATPITTMELILGKGVAAALPGSSLRGLPTASFWSLRAFLAASPRVFGVFVNPMWLVALLVLAPLLTIMAVNFGLIISSRVSDPRSAEQLGALIILPLMLLFIVAYPAFIALNSTTFWLTSLLVAVADVALAYFAVVLFQRETILTRWK